MGPLVPEGFKPPSLAKFDGRSDPCEQVASINTQMVIIGAPTSLKCNLLLGTFREVALRWYMGLPRATNNNYQEWVKKLMHEFATSRHWKVSTTSLLNIFQDPSESLRDYHACFNEATVNIVPPNQ